MGESYTAAIHRILDANLDRAREGLRIIEEWCRFGLNQQSLAAHCKQMRQTLAAWHHDELRAARDTPGDLGTQLTHPDEESRLSLDHLLRANLCRIQEALRVLEEYSKLYNSEMALTCKQMRYQVYTLESNLLDRPRHQQLAQARLYLVTAPIENLYDTVEAALKGGLRLVQYRDKELDDSEKLLQAEKLCQVCHQHEALFIVNDRVDLALAVNADGVHLGQDDVPISVARQVLGPQRLIGRSTTNPEELQRAIAEGADYVGVGPVYATPTKPNKAAAGLDYVRYAAEHCPLPWYAIGGVEPQNLSAVIAAGAQRVAVVRALMVAEQPRLVAQHMTAELAHAARD
ncbi:MAG: thiamine phosphate synthase [Spirulinaceae cyanobacterium SM2_1_0]|nr:thiamine phosphate synthase [Spirulinaceae cyanobacterium SM2_1_0]